MRLTHGNTAPLVCIRPPGWVTPSSGPIADLVAWVERAEELGFNGAFVGDRMLSEATTPSGAVVYGASMLDVTVALATMAARTERILLGPLVLVFPYRHPVQLAKTFASLDAASGGRVVLGAGIGWNAREFEVLGLPMAGRGERFEEAVDVVRRLWSGEPVTHSGPNWQFADVQIVPPPARPGGPPVWLASFSPGQALDWTDELPPLAQRQLDRVGRLADGWVPLVYSASAKRRLEASTLAAAWGLVLESAATAGRGREDIDFVFSDWGYVLDGPGAEDRCKQALARFFDGSCEDAQRTYTIGTADEVLAKVRAHTAGIDRVDAYIFTPLSDELEQMELWAGVAEHLRAGTGAGAR
ncbi:MAG: TIGR03619 family F420-dependent LLM class oxidoreductase [Actinomycetota bacterium]|nr:TIGR03619 family F420-dependent LLM class oxidoreductase [Actinomycetota bacterium]